MALTSDLIARFVKAAKGNDDAKKETTVYGTIVEFRDSQYVRLDGSTLLTPISKTSDVRHNDRVTVLIKNHTAVVTGNLTSPSARVAEVNTIRGDLADFNTVVAKKADISVLNAQQATINTLSANKLDASEATLKYANIDFTNIGKAAMEYFYAKSGLIDNVVVGDQTITGELIGVTISGDRLIGNTVIAEKLVIKGSDGLYYKLNTDGMKVEAEQTDENSLNGQIIKAKSITATKIAVDDLVAFGATIGGFHITDSSLYSGVKESVDNTTRGIYLGKDGQMSVGDSSNFIKYYKDTDGKYKLAISVDSLTISSGADIGTALENIQNGIDNIEIGGRNLYRNSSFYMGKSYWYGSNDTSASTTEIDGKTVLKCDATTTTQEIGYVVQVVPDIELAKDYTVSAKIYTPTAMEVIVSAWYSPGSWDGIQVKRCQLTVGWNDVAMTFTSNESDPNLIVGFGAVNTAVFYLYQPKLERGNKATAWTLALEDNPNSYTTESYVNDSINNVEIGGRNLVAGTSRWTEYVGNMSGIAAGYKDVWAGRTIFAPTGTEYVVSFDAKGDIEQTITCYFYGPNTTLTSASSTGQSKGNIADGSCQVSITTEWARYWVKWTQTPTDAIKNIIVGRNHGENNVYIRAVKFEAGNKPTDWTPAPEDVNTDISNAAKTATNFIYYDSTSGLQVGNRTSGSWSGFRTQITSSAYNILNAAGATLASYGEKLIELGKNATDAVIKFCGGKGQIEYTTDPDDGESYLQVSADKLRLKSSQKSSLYSMYTNNSSRWEKSAVNVTPKTVSMYASECIDPTLVEKVEGWSTSEFDMNGTDISGTADRVAFTARKGMTLETAAGEIKINGMRFGVNKMLWSGGAYMNGAQTVPLSEAISKQTNGIVLVFSYFDGGVPKDHSFSSHFISKYEIAAKPDCPHTFLMAINAGLSTFGAKYLYIGDNLITGHASNMSTGTSECGIKFSNDKYVLRYVIGV